MNYWIRRRKLLFKVTILRFSGKEEVYNKPTLNDAIKFAKPFAKFVGIQKITITSPEKEVTVIKSV